MTFSLSSADKKKLLGVIRTEILLIADKYGDDRRTSIGFDEYDISMEDLIPVTNTVITMTKLGYIKRMSLVQIGNHQFLVLYEAVHALAYHAKPLLDGFLESTADSHHLAYRLHA